MTLASLRRELENATAAESEAKEQLAAAQKQVKEAVARRRAAEQAVKAEESNASVQPDQAKLAGLRRRESAAAQRSSSCQISPKLL